MLSRSGTSLSAAVHSPLSCALGPQPSDPAPVEAVRAVVERAGALVDALVHLRRGLDRGAGLPHQLLFPVLAPAADQLRRHLDVALHPEMPAQDERLVG